jgi:hypothetical protein
MKSSIAFLASMALVSLATIGCGGSSTVAGPGGGGDGGSGSSSGSGTASGGTASGGTTSGGTASGGTASGGTASGGTASGGTASGGTASGGTAGTSSGGGAPGGSMSSLPCGSTQCAIPAEVCCVSANANPPPDFSYACYTGTCPVDDAGAVGAGGPTALQCSGAANCPANTVCCVTQQPGGGVASSCVATCDPAGSAQLCDPNAANSGCSQDAGACSSANVTDWGLPSSYATCGGVGN